MSLLLQGKLQGELPRLQDGASVGVRFIEPAGRMNPTLTKWRENGQRSHRVKWSKRAKDYA